MVRECDPIAIYARRDSSLTDLGSYCLGASVLNLSFQVRQGSRCRRRLTTTKIPATLVIASSLYARFVALLVAAIVTLASLPFVTIPEGSNLCIWAQGCSGWAGFILGLLCSPTNCVVCLHSLVAKLIQRATADQVVVQVDGQVQSFAEALALVPKQGLGAY